MVCPASMVLALAPENTDTAAACVPKPAASVNVGFTAVAVSVGASFTGTTVTVEAIGQRRGVNCRRSSYRRCPGSASA